MPDTGIFEYKLPSGEVRQEPRRQDQDDPKYAILATRDGSSWGLYRMTRHDEVLLRSVKALLQNGQSAYVTGPRAVDE